MITVKFLGGARKTFQIGQMQLERDRMDIDGLLDELIRMAPPGSGFDGRNILVAVNGTDSSALQGASTTIRSGDVVSIIPVIHGGAADAMRLRISGRSVCAMGLRRTDSILGLLEDLRQKHPGASIQAVSKRFVASPTHAEKIIRLSMESEKRGIMLARKLEVDMLMRFALAGQISEAIRAAGAKPGQGSILICIGRKADVDSIVRRASPLQDRMVLAGGARFLKTHFGITGRHMAATRSECPLEDILVEKAAVIP